MLKPIPDYLKAGLLVLFVGFNPSIKSSETGHHFSNPNNRFWMILHQSGITPRKYTTEEDQNLLELGYGFTNIVARPTKAADEITKEEYTIGRGELIQKISTYRPKIVCFVGKGVYLQYARKKQACWGVQTEAVVLGTIDFVAPSSSGLVRMKLDDIVDIYKELPKLFNR